MIIKMHQIKSRFQTFPCRKAYDQNVYVFWFCLFACLRFFFKVCFIVVTLHDLQLYSTSGFKSKKDPDINYGIVLQWGLFNFESV